MLTDQIPEAPRPVALIPVGAEAESVITILAFDLRQAGVNVELAYKGNVGKRMKRANKLNAAIAILIGEDELAKNSCTYRDLDAGTQEDVSLDNLLSKLTEVN